MSVSRGIVHSLPARNDTDHVADRGPRKRERRVAGEQAGIGEPGRSQELRGLGERDDAHAVDHEGVLNGDRHERRHVRLRHHRQLPPEHTIARIAARRRRPSPPRGSTGMRDAQSVTSAREWTALARVWDVGARARGRPPTEVDVDWPLLPVMINTKLKVDGPTTPAAGSVKLHDCLKHPPCVPARSPTGVSARSSDGGSGRRTHAGARARASGRAGVQRHAGQRRHGGAILSVVGAHGHAAGPHARDVGAGLARLGRVRVKRRRRCGAGRVASTHRSDSPREHARAAWSRRNALSMARPFTPSPALLLRFADPHR